MTTHLFSRNFNTTSVKGFGTHIIDSEPVCYHRHDFYEVFYIISGEVSHLVNGQPQKLYEGDLIFLSPNDSHMFCDVTAARCLRRDIMMSPEMFCSACNYISPSFHDELFSEKIPTVYHISPKKVEAFEKKLTLAVVNSTVEPELSVQLMKAFTIELLNIFVQHKINITTTNQPKWLSELMTKFSSASYFNTDTADILKDYHYNISYLRRAFKAYTGFTMTEYRKKQQLEHAKLLLTSTNETIEKIAFSCGFNNVTYFYRYFKSEEGVSPKSYRDTPFN